MVRGLIERSSDVFTIGREGKPVWEKRFHPRTRDWHSNALGAEDATDDVVAWLHTELLAAARRAGHEWTDEEKLDHLGFLSAQGVDPYYYDVPFDRLTERFRGVPPEGPPTAKDGGELDEITPFCFPPKGDRPTAEDRERGVRLVEKSIQSCFRLPFLRAAFPEATYVLVVRDPRASIASLMSAWLHPRMFFSYRVPVELDIKGYSDRFPWGRQWWNLSLAPGWRDWVHLPLAEVCARSWLTHNEWILRDAAPLLDSGDAVLVRYEDVLKDPTSAMRSVATTTGLPFADVWQEKELPVVMTQTAPDPDKWRSRYQEITEVLPLVAPLARKLGYDVE